MWRTLSPEQVEVEKMCRAYGLSKFAVLAALRFDENSVTSEDTKQQWDTLASNLASIPTPEKVTAILVEIIRNEENHGEGDSVLSAGLKTLCIRKLASFFPKTA